MSTEANRGWERPMCLFGVVLAGLVFLISGSVGAQTPICMTTCGSGGGGMTCTVSVTMCSDAAYVFFCPVNNFTTTATGTLNAACNVGTLFDGVAMATHTAGQGSNANCSFQFRGICGSTAACAYGMGHFVTCQVDQSEGLPVELLDFSLESRTTAATSAEEAPAEETPP